MIQPLSADKVQKDEGIESTSQLVVTGEKHAGRSNLESQKQKNVTWDGVPNIQKRIMNIEAGNPTKLNCMDVPQLALMMDL